MNDDDRERLAELENEAVSRYSDLHPEGISWGEVADAQSQGFGLDEAELAELTRLRILDDVFNDTEARIREVAPDEILKVLTDGMFWHQEGPGFSCDEAEAIAAAAYRLGADLAEMTDLVVTGHGQPGRSEDEGDLHYHQEEA